MDNKVIVSLFVPEVNKKYDLFLPVNKKVGNVIMLLNKYINENSNNNFPISNNNSLYNVDTMEVYPVDVIVFDTNIRNGTKLMLIS